MPASTRGFTLVELLVVLALLALTFALIVPNIGALVPSARLSASGKQILRDSKLNVQPADDLDDAAQKIVKAVKG